MYRRVLYGAPKMKVKILVMFALLSYGSFLKKKKNRNFKLNLNYYFPENV